MNRAAQPRTEAEIRALTDRLFHYASVGFVHGNYNGPQNAVFDCVARGHMLTPAQSAQYRLEVQAYLVTLQTFFARLDQDIAFASDVLMDRRNNVGSQGIPGRHDYHDASARGNQADIQRSLQNFADAGWFRQVALANNVNKDLMDLMVHMAPAVHSVGVREKNPDAPEFRNFYSAMKAAQTLPVNSAAYWTEIDRALAAYTRLVYTVQNQLAQHARPAVLTFAGTFASLQTIAPPLHKEPVRLRSDQYCRVQTLP